MTAITVADADHDRATSLAADIGIEAATDLDQLSTRPMRWSSPPPPTPTPT